MAMTGDQPLGDAEQPARDRIPPIDRRSLNLPNLITLSRLLLAVLLFVLIYIEGLWITAAVVFIVAAATDYLDGYIARKYGLVTTLGRILDPFVDKFIICGAFIFLLEKQVRIDPPAISGAASVTFSGVTSWMVIVVIGREMFVTSLRAFLEQHGRDFSASWSGKIKMGLQCVAVTASLLSLSDQIASPAFNTTRDVLLWTMVAFTAYSGVTYTWRAYTMLRLEAEQFSGAA